MSDLTALNTMAASTLLVAVSLYDDVLTPEDALQRAHEEVRAAWNEIQALNGASYE